MAALFSTPISHRLLYTSLSIKFSLFPSTRISIFWASNRASSGSLAMQAAEAMSTEQHPLGVNETIIEEYADQSTLLKEFTNFSNINKAWIFKSTAEKASRAMFSVGQPNLLANKKRTVIHTSHISKPTDHFVNFEWGPFPIEMTDVSIVVPSPSGSKLLVVRNKENESPTHLEIWGPNQLEKEIHVPKSVHGSIYTDGWFEGISWNHMENLIAYVAEAPAPLKPKFNDLGYNREASKDNECDSWKGQGDWEEHWGETYSNKRKPSLFVVNITSGEVQVVNGIPKFLSIGQVVWSPSIENASLSYLVFVGWIAENGAQKTSRKLGMKYCYNRPCALYTVGAPFQNSNAYEVMKDHPAINLTPALSSAFFPHFSPDGISLLFLSARSSVDSGAHSATDSLHKMDWPSDGLPDPSISITDVVPVVMCPVDGCFPGLYCSSFLVHPWLSDGCTMILSSAWGSTQSILAVNISNCKVSRVSPSDTFYSWDVLALDGNNILAVCSSPVDPPQLKYGFHLSSTTELDKWDWLDVPSPLDTYNKKIRSLLSSHKCNIFKIPVSNPSDSLPQGAKNPFEAIFVHQDDGCCNPSIVVLHGGPHSVSLTSYSKTLAFLTSLGYNLLIVNYRGSLGFGEEALQSLPGNIGSQDVNDVLAALDYVTRKGLIDVSKIAVLGGSHGGFLTTHLIGQAPEKFAVAAVRNPVCNLSLMVGTTDIPDWCYVESFGYKGKEIVTEAPSPEHLCLFYNKSPISHLHKVKVPVLFLLGAQDLRVPVSNGLQYARALREKGGEVKVVVFPDDVHGIERPQSDFESFLNIGVWFKKYCC